AVVGHLAHRYGSRLGEVLALLGRDRTLAAPIAAPLPDPRAEVVAAVEREWALTPEDVLRRRTHVALCDPEQGTGVAAEVAALMARALGWDPARIRGAADAYVRAVAAVAVSARPVRGRAAGARLDVTRESPAARRARARAIARALARAYPDAWCALHYRTPWELLVATILSAQCTDKMVNTVTPALFAAFPTPAALAAADPARVE